MMWKYEVSIKTEIAGRNERWVRAEARTIGNHVLHGGLAVSVGRPLADMSLAQATAEAIAEATESMERLLAY
jgi:hypothetical protein